MCRVEIARRAADKIARVTLKLGGKSASGYLRRRRPEGRGGGSARRRVRQLGPGLLCPLAGLLRTRRSGRIPRAPGDRRHGDGGRRPAGRRHPHGPADLRAAARPSRRYIEDAPVLFQETRRRDQATGSPHRPPPDHRRPRRAARKEILARSSRCCPSTPRTKPSPGPTTRSTGSPPRFGPKTQCGRSASPTP